MPVGMSSTAWHEPIEQEINLVDQAPTILPHGDRADERFNLLRQIRQGRGARGHHVPDQPLLPRIAYVQGNDRVRQFLPAGHFAPLSEVWDKLNVTFQ
jgi:hypothetical protein